VVATIVVVAFIATMVSNGTILPSGNDDRTGTTGTTLVPRPSLPGEQTGSTLGGISVRCKDGTYSFAAGGEKNADNLCKDNGGVDQRLPN
jgi:hypothetical protein